jgi:chloramphenicol 3-O phosphotransferase
MSSGRLVLLNGPSSSGKTTITKAVVGRLRTPWLVLPMDLFHHVRSRPDASLTDRQPPTTGPSSVPPRAAATCSVTTC